MRKRKKKRQTHQRRQRDKFCKRQELNSKHENTPINNAGVVVVVAAFLCVCTNVVSATAPAHWMLAVAGVYFQNFIMKSPQAMKLHIDSLLVRSFVFLSSRRHRCVRCPVNDALAWCLQIAVCLYIHSFAASITHGHPKNIDALSETYFFFNLFFCICISPFPFNSLFICFLFSSSGLLSTNISRMNINFDLKCSNFAPLSFRNRIF